MASVSKITLVGRLGRDPETRYTPNGRMNVTFTMAVSRRRNDASGQQQETTNWFRVTAWGGLAEVCDRLSQQGALVKGREVFVSGRFEARDYQDQQGQMRYSLDVNADDIQLVGSSRDGGGGGGEFGGPVRGGQGGQPGGGEHSDNSMDDVPF
jgi:single-strand DNA-binding protein